MRSISLGLLLWVSQQLEACTRDFTQKQDLLGQFFMAIHFYQECLRNFMKEFIQVYLIPRYFHGYLKLKLLWEEPMWMVFLYLFQFIQQKERLRQVVLLVLQSFQELRVLYSMREPEFIQNFISSPLHACFHFQLPQDWKQALILSLYQLQSELEWAWKWRHSMNPLSFMYQYQPKLFLQPLPLSHSFYHLFSVSFRFYCHFYFILRSFHCPCLLFLCQQLHFSHFSKVSLYYSCLITQLFYYYQSQLWCSFKWKAQFSINSQSKQQSQSNLLIFSLEFHSSYGFFPLDYLFPLQSSFYPVFHRFIWGLLSKQRQSHSFLSNLLQNQSYYHQIFPPHLQYFPLSLTPKVQSLCYFMKFHSSQLAVQLLHSQHHWQHQLKWIIPHSPHLLSFHRWLFRQLKPSQFNLFHLRLQQRFHLNLLYHQLYLERLCFVRQLIFFEWYLFTTNLNLRQYLSSSPLDLPQKLVHRSHQQHHPQQSQQDCLFHSKFIQFHFASFLLYLSLHLDHLVCHLMPNSLYSSPKYLKSHQHPQFYSLLIRLLFPPLFDYR